MLALSVPVSHQSLSSSQIQQEGDNRKTPNKLSPEVDWQDSSSSCKYSVWVGLGKRRKRKSAHNRPVLQTIDATLMQINLCFTRI